MTISQNFPSVAPSLNLDFANSQQLDPRITFSRPTTAAYYDANTTALAEQNLVLQSQAFGTTPWATGNTTVTVNTTTAPDGTTTGSKLIGTATTGAHNLYVAVGFTAPITTTYTWSIYAKAAEYSWFYIDSYTSGGQPNYFDLTNGVIGTLASGNTATITSVGNGWYRCTVTRTVTSGQTVNFAINLATANNTGSFTGDGTSGSYIWGAQLEQRSSVTAYNPTTTTAITNYIPVLLTAPTNQARFDHDPVARTSLGLLIEQQSTNLLTWSSAFNQSTWVANATYISVAANSTIAPDGTQTANLLTDTTSSGGHAIYQNGSVTSGTAYTLSCYAKAGSLNFLALSFSDGTTNWGATFNVSTGSGIATLGSFNAPTTTSMTAVGNNWYRCSISMTAGATASGVAFANIGMSNASGVRVYAGTGQTLFTWGAQLEALAFPTSYIPTVASQVTRSADNASMTGTNFSSWYSTGQGTFYSEAKSYYNTLSSGGARYLLANVNLNAYYLYANQSSTNMQSYDGANVLATAVTDFSAFTKYVSAYSTTTKTITNNGLSVTSGTYNQGWGSNTSIGIGNAGNGSSFWNGYIKKLAYYPIAVSSTNLQALTGN